MTCKHVYFICNRILPGKMSIRYIRSDTIYQTLPRTPRVVLCSATGARSPVTEAGEQEVAAKGIIILLLALMSLITLRAKGLVDSLYLTLGHCDQHPVLNYLEDIRARAGGE